MNIYFTLWNQNAKTVAKKSLIEMPVVYTVRPNADGRIGIERLIG